MDPQEPIIYEPVVDVLLPLRKSSSISQPPESYMGMLTKEVKKIFLMKDKGYGGDPNTFDEMT